MVILVLIKTPTGVGKRRTPIMLNCLLELRRRIWFIILVFFCCFLVFFFCSNTLFYILVKPLLAVLPNRDALIATRVTAPAFMPITLAADMAILCTMPFALWQLWCFAAPGLYQRERYNLCFITIASLLLFCFGVLFCFFLILPYMFQFLVKATPPNVHFMPDMSEALNFITHMLLIFGLCFQIPLLCLSLVRLGWTNLATLKKMRPYVIVSAFIVAMLLTPPDVFSQVMLAIPLCLLYELGIILEKAVEAYTRDLSKC